MQVIVVTTTGADRKLSGLLKSIGNLSMLCVETETAVFSGDHPDIVFVSGQMFSQISCRNAAMIVRSGGCLPERLACENAVAIVDSSNKPVLELVAQRRLRALTCGLASSDTLTLSSLTSDSAMISLQRPIAAFDGTLVDPFELPVSFDGRAEPFSMLACAAIFCLMGAKNPLAQSPGWTVHAFKSPPQSLI